MNRFKSCFHWLTTETLRSNQGRDTVIQCCFQVSSPIKFCPAQVLSSVVQCCQIFPNAFNCFQKMSGAVKRFQGAAKCLPTSASQSKMMVPKSHTPTTMTSQQHRKRLGKKLRNNRRILGKFEVVFGAGHLKGSRLLSCFASYYQHNIGWGDGGTVRSLALHSYATLLWVLLHFHTYVMICCCKFSCTSTHTSCYAAISSLALPHIRHATPL